MNWTIIGVLMLFGAIQGFVMMLILIFKKKENKKANQYLRLILFGLSMNLIYYFFYVVDLVKQIPEIKLFYMPWAFLAAISFYLYVAFISPFKKKLTGLNKIGFIPFVFFSLLTIITRWFNYFNSEELRIAKSILYMISSIEEYLSLIFSLFVGYLSYKSLNETEEELQKQFSNYNNVKLAFHRRFIIVVLVFCVIWFGITIYYEINGVFSYTLYHSIWLFIAFIIHWIAWTGFINDEALLPTFEKEAIPDIVEEVVISEKKKGIKVDKNNEHYKSLISLFEKEQLFLNPDLSLEKVSKKLNISKSYLSALINQTTNKNFYHFVNSYRTEYLISLFKEEKHKEYTILSLAYEAGFNSKSTFQAYFKKTKGKTPSQFIKELNFSNSVA